MRKADYFTPTVMKNSSGAQAFTGEDHEEEERLKRQRAEQREYLMKQMEEKKQKKAIEKRQDFLYDQQRLAITIQVDKNQQEFEQRNIIMSLSMQDQNQKLDAERKQRENEKRQAELARDREELAWTNATKLNFQEGKSYADKYLK